ncbi:hypothetical protein VKT23_004914 [Stygiomarasmius scandens]|uniref:ABC transmembrane type-1 domain-containing protein n=1 Tax=Marasmiellus scandens TaxID=2682957 RepID=A0ABR1JSK5_9AGAR
MSEQVVLGFRVGRISDVDFSGWSKSLTFPEIGRISSLDSSVWSNSLTFPSYAVVASAALLFLHVSVSIFRNRRREEQPNVSGWSRIRTHVQGLGGRVIFGYMTLRALTSLALFAISLASLVSGSSKHTLPNNISLCLTFGYTSVLTLLSLLTKRRWSSVLIRHVNTIHFVAFVVYAYRDLYPLTLFDQTPQDAAEGSLLWARVGLLTFVAIVIPLVIPRQYIPFNPDKPESPNPEQTASLLSLVLYNFMNPIIFKSWRVSNLQLDREDLPPLSDYDHAANLKTRMFRYLDPMKVKRRNVFFSLMRAFRTDYAVLFTMLILRALSGFSTPIAVKQLLQYVEMKGVGVPTKPWVWIIWLFLGPTIDSLSFEWYIFVATRALVRTEAILTQLVFEHALRIRMKSETNDQSKDKDKQTPTEPTTPRTPTPVSVSQTDSDSENDNATVQAEDTDTQGDGSSTIVATSREPSDGSSSSRSIKKGKQAPPPPPATPTPTPAPATAAADDEKKSKAANLVGRMNNLVTSDLQSIVDARDFGMLVVYTPIQLVLCVIFLYAVLGWSSFVGLGTIIILFPLPGYLAKLVQKVQKAKMKKTDARIETVTETMNVLRMVKMFGWERLMNERIAEKREEELSFIKRMRLLDLATMMTNHIIPLVTMLVTYAT